MLHAFLFRPSVSLHAQLYTQSVLAPPSPEEPPSGEYRDAAAATAAAAITEAVDACIFTQNNEIKTMKLLGKKKKKIVAAAAAGKEESVAIKNGRGVYAR